jgi:predicted kinase
VSGRPSRITVVTGAPGAGKTTFSRLLAAQDPRGIHLRSDVFYGFPAHPVDPTKPESHEQNTVVIHALGRAAGAFAEAGWPVVLDGIFGPWFLPELRAALPAGAPLEYVVLRAPLDVCLRRVRERQGPGESRKVEHMHRAFAELGALSGHALDATAGGPEALLATFLAARAQGRFRLEAPCTSPTPSR